MQVRLRRAGENGLEQLEAPAVALHQWIRIGQVDQTGTRTAQDRRVQVGEPLQRFGQPPLLVIRQHDDPPSPRDDAGGLVGSGAAPPHWARSTLPEEVRGSVSSTCIRTAADEERRLAEPLERFADLHAAVCAVRVPV